MPDPETAFESCLAEALAAWNIALAPEKLRAFRAHFEAVVAANEKMNLTRITEPSDAAIKHYADSLALLAWVRDRGHRPARILDVGTGAGFPAVPLAVMEPDWSITAIDATRKKAAFVERTAQAIGIDNLHCEHAHSQHWNSPAPFPMVVCRALASATQAIELTARHVSSGGWIVLYQSARNDGVLEAKLDTRAGQLKLEPEDKFDYELRLGDEVIARTLRIYRKR